jgi:A/G-specific adenine glycosylase
VNLPLNFAEQICDWQRTHGRQQLPWQQTRDPYRVWLSEIMLQQTQVATVLAYYARFLDLFPDVNALAAAPLDAVLAAWSGLGYYSRARNLHRCAQIVIEAHGGSFPNHAAGLQELPGIGRSTAAAIAAFCFNERAAILDGNVKRVLSRVCAFEGDLASTVAERELWSIATEGLPRQPDDMGAYTQGLMDLGATICMPKQPHCLLCPAQGMCQAQRQGRMEAFPVKTRKLRRSQRENWWLCLQADSDILLQQRPAKGVWAGLWSLPLLDSPDAVLAFESTLPLGPEQSIITQPAIKHALTHFDWTLHPCVAQLSASQKKQAQELISLGMNKDPCDDDDSRGLCKWVSIEDALALGLPAPLKKWLLHLSEDALCA